MPRIPNALPPQAGARSRRADQATRNTPAARQSFEDYLSHATAASQDPAPAIRGDRKPERAEKPREDTAAQGKSATAKVDKQPTRSETAPDDAPVVDATQGGGATGEELPIPVCLAPPTPSPIEGPSGDVVEAKPEVDQPVSPEKSKAAIEWGDKPLRPGPGAASAGDVLPTPKEPQVCTGGPGAGADLEEVDGPNPAVTEAAKAVADGATSAPVNQPERRAAESADAQKFENAEGARPREAEKRPDAPHVKRPEVGKHSAAGKLGDTQPDLADEIEPQIDKGPASRTQTHGKIDNGQRPQAVHGSEAAKPARTSEADNASSDPLKHIITDMKVIAADESPVESQGAFNPAAEIGRILVPIDSRGQTTQRGTPAAASDHAARPIAAANEPAVLKAPAASAEPAGTPGGAEANMERLVKVLSGSRGESNWRVALRLDPPEMGRLHIHARMEDGGLSLNVAADNDAVRRTIESRIGELRDALGERGIRLDAADVRVRPGGEPGHGTAREQTTGGHGDSSPRGFSQGQSSQGQASNRGDGGSWQSPGGFGQSYGGEARQPSSGWSGPMGLADVAATSETSVDLVA